MADSPSSTDIEQQNNIQNNHGRKEPIRQRWNIARPFHTPSPAMELRTKYLTSKLDDPDTSIRTRALHCLFKLSPNDILHWRGLLVLFHHLEHLFEELMNPYFDPIWSIIGRNIPKYPVEVWHWCFAVIEAYDSPITQDPSIESIYKYICQPRSQQNHGGRGTVSLSEKECILQAIFAVLCWTTGTLTPLLGDRALRARSKVSDLDGSNEVNTGTSLFAENCAHIYSASELRRPTSKMFRSYLLRPDDNGGQFGAKTNLQPFQSPRTPDFIFEDMLHVSSLNYDSLCTIGGVRVKWVDVLTAHLAFDRAKRELSVYQYPSFCATKILSQHRIEVLESITEALLPCDYSIGLPNEPASIYREVLLSYRLLFGQSKSSRKLMKTVLQSSKTASGSEFPRNNSSMLNDERDGFLETLCTLPLYPGSGFSCLWFGKKSTPRIAGHLFPISSRNVSDELIESDTYSARDDFPVFGTRLLALQRYNMRRQPSKIWDLWRDRRNPLQWYTFWAVVVVGSTGLLLATLQLGVGVVQMAYAIRSLELSKLEEKSTNVPYGHR